jgi:pre-mRNA 3'-end-processing factor FIP1
MQMLMQQMASSGMDPSQMDFGTFMQMAGQGMGGGFGGPPQQQSGGFQQGNQGGGGRGGRGGRGRAW